MKRMRLFAAVLLVALAATGLSCLPDRSPTAPVVPPPNASLLGGLLQATGLLQCTPLPYASTTKTIGPAGGGVPGGAPPPNNSPGALPPSVSGTARAPPARGDTPPPPPQSVGGHTSPRL